MPGPARTNGWVFSVHDKRTFAKCTFNGLNEGVALCALLKKVRIPCISLQGILTKVGTLSVLNHFIYFLIYRFTYSMVSKKPVSSIFRKVRVPKIIPTINTAAMLTYLTILLTSTVTLMSQPSPL